MAFPCYSFITPESASIMDEDEILREIDQTDLCEKVKKLRELYAILSEKQQTFCEGFNLHCVKGCGHCCEHFVPDVTRLEAAFLAIGLIAEGKDEEVLERIKSNEHPERCMFFNPDGEYHCTVYKWRPLICRLFGASVYLDKEGRAVYRHCKWNPDAPVLTREQLEAREDILVLMSEYGLMLDECDTADTERELLPLALEKAIFKVRFVMELEEESDS